MRLAGIQQSINEIPHEITLKAYTNLRVCGDFPSVSSQVFDQT